MSPSYLGFSLDISFVIDLWDARVAPLESQSSNPSINTREKKKKKGHLGVLKLRDCWCGRRDFAKVTCLEKWLFSKNDSNDLRLFLGNQQRSERLSPSFLRLPRPYFAYKLHVYVLPHPKGHMPTPSKRTRICWNCAISIQLLWVTFHINFISWISIVVSHSNSTHVHVARKSGSSYTITLIETLSAKLFGAIVFYIQFHIQKYISHTHTYNDSIEWHSVNLLQTSYLLCHHRYSY